MIETPFIGRRRKTSWIVTTIVLTALLGFSLYIAGALLPWGASSPLEPSRQWIGWVMVALSALGIAGMIRTAARDDTVFRLDHQGATVPDWSERTIPWSAVDGASEWASRGSEFVVLRLVDPSQYPGKGLLGRIDVEGLSGGHVPIAVTLSDRSPDAVLAAIDYFRKYSAS